MPPTDDIKTLTFEGRIAAALDGQAAIREGQATIKDDISEIRQSLGKIGTSLEKLAVFEERQLNFNGAIDRAFKEIVSVRDELKAHDARIRVFENAAGITNQTTTLVQKVVTIVIVAVISGLLTLVVSRAPIIQVAPVASPAQPSAPAK